MKNKKLFIMSFLLMLVAIISFTSTSVYADTTPTAKPILGTYYFLDNYYATPNFDVKRALEAYKDKLTWDGFAPYADEDNEVYMEFGEYPADDEVLILQPHLGIGKNVYGTMTRIHRFESYDGKAEYMIAYSHMDQIVCIVDGHTYKDDLGILVNDFFKNKVTESDRRDYYFQMPYKNVDGLEGKGCMSGYEEDGERHVAFAIFNIGFNFSTNSTPTNQQEDLEDPAIYGGNDEVQIDDTPTQPESSDTFDGWQIVGIVASSIASLVGIYLIYLLGKKIYEIMKG